MASSRRTPSGSGPRTPCTADTRRRRLPLDHLLNDLPVPVNGLITLGSLAVLVASADFAISRAVTVARHYGVSPLIIGTTLVAMSTSLAELAVNMAVTVTGGDNAIVVGNVVGSNLVNIGVGLGLAAFIVPIHTHTLVVEREILIYFAVTALLTSLALDRSLSHVEGGVLVFCFAVILFMIYQYAARERESAERWSAEPETAEPESANQGSMEPGNAERGNAQQGNAQQGSIERRSEEWGSEGRGVPETSAPVTWGDLSLVIVALLLLVLAAEVLVQSVSAIALGAGVDPYIIGLTVVGIGTSLPEIATSVQAARRGQVDLVLGNVFGSNVFNICIALGLPALIRQVPVPDSAIDDLYFINLFGIGVVFLLLGESRFFGENKVIGRWGGLLIALVYAGYIAYKVAM